jgi:hypothetical protein
LAKVLVLRLENKAVDILKNFPIQRAEDPVDYGPVEIAGKNYWLPVRAAMQMSSISPQNYQTRNIIEFRRYRKFEAEIKIVPDADL